MISKFHICIKGLIVAVSKSVLPQVKGGQAARLKSASVKVLVCTWPPIMLKRAGLGIGALLTIG